jgi:hypothetical protein
MPRYFVTLLLPIASIVLGPCSATAEVLPAGTHLEVRLSTPSGSRISHPGDHIEATVIAPVFADGRLLIPQGALVSGVVAGVERLGLGLKHPTAGIAYRFDTVQLPDGAALPIDARVAQVETAKERVNAEGVIGGIYPTANVSSSAAFYVLPLLCVDPQFGVPMLGVKFLIARSPDPEIYFPAGTEVILQLIAEADIPYTGNLPQDVGPLSAVEMANGSRVLAELPQQRTDRGRNRPSDLINILVLGDRESINRAFQAAGWTGAQRSSIRSIYRMYHCMVQRMGYSMAPMGKLTFNGVTADAEYQKSLNTFSKRHHVRLWKQEPGDTWLGAATEDVSYKLRKMHLTHATDPIIDNERAKVFNDLAYTGCVEAATLMTRDSSDDINRRELSIKTDGKVAVLRMSDCQNPRIMANESTASGPHAPRRFVQAMVALRNDLIRTNPVSLAYSTIRALQDHEQRQENGSMSAFDSKRQKADSPKTSVQPAWSRPSVLDVMTVAIDSRDEVTQSVNLRSQANSQMHPVR